MVGLPVVGIFYSAEGYAEITNNFVAKLTSPVLASNCWVKVLGKYSIILHFVLRFLILVSRCIHFWYCGEHYTISYC